MRIFYAMGDLVLLLLATFLELVHGTTYSFCAENHNFVFAAEACPGGILFKSAVTINETCHCFPSDVAIYPSCVSALAKDNSVRVKIPHSDTSCSRTPGLRSQQVQLIIPLGSKSPSTISTFCPYIPSSCASMPQNQALTSPVTLVKEFDTEQYSERPGQILKQIDADKQQSKQLPPIPIIGSYPDLKNLTNYTETSSSNVEPEPSLPPDNQQIQNISSPFIANSRTVFHGEINDTANAETKRVDDEIPIPIKEEKIPVPINLEEKAINEILLASNIELLPENDDNSLAEEGMKINKRMSDDNETDFVVDGDSGKDYILRTLADKLTDELINDAPAFISQSKGALLLQKSVEMFKQLAPKEIIQDSIVDDVFRTFVSSHMFGIGYVSSHNSYITDDMYHQIMHGLSLCQDRDEGFSEYVFESNSFCPPTIQKFINMKTKTAISVDELHSRLPESFGYVPEKENFVVGLMWKIVEAIHAECFGTWLKYDGSIPIFYYSFLEHFFLQDDVISLFENESTGTSRYERIIESDKPLKDISFNVDTLVSAIHSKSQYPNFFTKPSPKDLDADKNRKKNPETETGDTGDTGETGGTDNSGSSEQTNSGETSSSGSTVTVNTDSDESPKSDKPAMSESGYIIVKSRSKRSLTEMRLNAFEIWDGKAYCLQKLDNSLPASVENSFPLLPQMCH